MAELLTKAYGQNQEPVRSTTHFEMRVPKVGLIPSTVTGKRTWTKEDTDLRRQSFSLVPSQRAPDSKSDSSFASAYTSPPSPSYRLPHEAVEKDVQGVLESMLVTLQNSNVEAGGRAVTRLYRSTKDGYGCAQIPRSQGCPGLVKEFALFVRFLRPTGFGAPQSCSRQTMLQCRQVTNNRRARTP